MKTVVTIPWHAVVQGVPTCAAATTGDLPLVIAARCERVTPAALDAIADAAAQSPMAMLSRSPASSLLELPIPADGTVAILTTDGQSAVVLQARSRPEAQRAFSDPAVRRDAFARSYVARYARLDPDARAFVPSDPHDESERNTRPHFEFLNPNSWGFKPTNNSMHWTAHNLFRSPNTPPTKPSPATRPRFTDPFEEPTAADRGDPFQCTPQLRQFRHLCDHATGGLAEPRAYWLALGLGRCRLFGVALSPADDFTLSPLSFDHAARHLIDYLAAAVDWLKDVVSRPDDYPAHLHRNIALELLEIRTDAHAAHLALDEAYAAARYENDPQADMMGRRLRQVRRMINVLDGNLQNNIPLLRPAASTFLLENWRRLLAPAHRDCPPWWLDGSLEQPAPLA